MLRCTRPFAAAAVISAVVVLWFVIRSARGATSPTIWTGLLTAALIIAWGYCLLDWLVRSRIEAQQPREQPRGEQEVDEKIRQLRSR